MQKVDGDPNAANATDRVDTVVIETEILFGGVAGEQPPKDEVDNYMAANKKDLGVEEFGLSRGTSFIFSNLRDAKVHHNSPIFDEYQTQSAYVGFGHSMKTGLPRQFK